MKILFICYGNICRSPSAEAVMKKLVKNENLDNKIFCDSAGINGYHEGQNADSRMRQHATKRGLNLTSISRQINPKVDFEKFDYIIGMDHENMNDLNHLDVGGKYKSKILKMTDFCTKINARDVPDPYYGGGKGFEIVLDILEDACEGLLENLKKEI